MSKRDVFLGLAILLGAILVAGCERATSNKPVIVSTTPTRAIEPTAMASATMMQPSPAANTPTAKSTSASTKPAIAPGATRTTALSTATRTRTATPPKSNSGDALDKALQELEDLMNKTDTLPEQP